MTFGRRLISVLVGAAMLAGCGTGDGETNEGHETVPADPPTSTKFTVNVEADRAQIIATAVVQVTTIDNTFGGSKVTSVVHLVENFDADRSRPLSPTDRATVIDAFRGYAEVIFVTDPKSLIGDNPMNAPRGLFIVTVGEPTIRNDHAEIRTSMWCGSLCATERTYSVDRQPSGWHVTGTVGTIRVS